VLYVRDKDIEAIPGRGHEQLGDLRVVPDLAGVVLALVDKEQLGREVAGATGNVSWGVVFHRKVPDRNGVNRAGGTNSEGRLVGGVPLDSRYG